MVFFPENRFCHFCENYLVSKQTAQNLEVYLLGKL